MLWRTVENGIKWGGDWWRVRHFGSGYYDVIRVMDWHETTGEEDQAKYVAELYSSLDFCYFVDRANNKDPFSGDSLDWDEYTDDYKLVQLVDYGYAHSEPFCVVGNNLKLVERAIRWFADKDPYWDVPEDCAPFDVIAETKETQSIYHPRYTTYTVRTLNIAKYIDARTNSDHFVNTGLVDLRANGWVCLDHEFQNGWYGGQRDAPKLIIKAMNNRGIDVLFMLGNVGQFETRWYTWVPVGKYNAAMDVLRDDYAGLPYDPGEELGKALRGEPHTAVTVRKYEIAKG